MDWLDLLSQQGTVKSLLQHHSPKASILLSAFFVIQLSRPYVTAGKTITLTRWTFVDKMMSQLLNMLSRLVITFLPRSKSLLKAGHAAAAAVAKSLQLCLTLCDPIDGSPLGSSVPGILRARILEWVAISFSNA